LKQHNENFNPNDLVYKRHITMIIKVGLHLRLLVCALSTVHHAPCFLSAACTTFIESGEKSLAHQHLLKKVFEKLSSRSLDDGQLQCRDLQRYGWRSFVSRRISPGKTFSSYTTRSSFCSYYSLSKEKHLVKNRLGKRLDLE